MGETAGKSTLLWNVPSSKPHCLGTWFRRSKAGDAAASPCARVCSRVRALTRTLTRGLADLFTSQTQLTSGERGSPGFLPAKREPVQPDGTVQRVCGGGGVGPPRPEPGFPAALSPALSLCSVHCSRVAPSAGQARGAGLRGSVGDSLTRKMGLEAGTGGGGGGEGPEEERRRGSAAALSYVGGQNPLSVTTHSLIPLLPCFPQPHSSGRIFRTRQGVPTSPRG